MSPDAGDGTMPLFLVEISVTLPNGMADDDRLRLAQDERDRGRQLVADGTLVSIWRVAGRLANVGVWEAGDHEELHAAISSLPMWPFMTVTITPLSRHPLSD